MITEVCAAAGRLNLGGVFALAQLTCQRPTGRPRRHRFWLSRVVADRGREGVVDPDWLDSQLEVNVLGKPAPTPSPGCWMLTNRVRPSGVESMPVISHSFGPTRKRRSVRPGVRPTIVASAKGVRIGYRAGAAVADAAGHGRQHLIVGLVGEA